MDSLRHRLSVDRSLARLWAGLSEDLERAEIDLESLHLVRSCGDSKERLQVDRSLSVMSIVSSFATRASICARVNGLSAMAPLSLGLSSTPVHNTS